MIDTTITNSVDVKECYKETFGAICLECGEVVVFAFSADESKTTICENCGAIYEVRTKIIATAIHNIERIR